MGMMTCYIHVEFQRVATCLQHVQMSRNLTVTVIVLFRWLGGIMVMTSDIWSEGCQFDSRSGRYQVLTTQGSDTRVRTQKNRWVFLGTPT